MGVSGFFGRNNLMGLMVSVDIPEEIYAGTDIPVKIIVSNRKRFMPSFLIKVKIGEADALFPIVGKTSQSSGLATMAFRARGRHEINGAYVSSAFPFNFFVRFRHLDLHEDLTVFPALKKCSMGRLLGYDEKSRGEFTIDRSGFASEIFSIREYRYGDPQKYIHWKASARTGKLKTKELSSLADKPLVLDLDRIAIADLEEKISSVAYAIVKSLRINIPVSLKIGERVINTLTPNSSGIATIACAKTVMLTELALYRRDL